MGEEPDSEGLEEYVVETYTPLEPYTFVCSGVFENINRDRLEKFLTDLGGRVTSAVSGKTDYLLIGTKLEDGREVNTSTKYKGAEKKNVPILNEDGLVTFLRRTLSNQYFTLDNYQNWTDPLGCKRRLKGLDKANIAADIDIGVDPEIKKKVGLLLTEKYKPVTTNDLIGNKCNVDSLIQWLKDWDNINIHGNKKKVKASFGSWRSAPNLNAKAALISGPPGIGKTSTARIV
jgi:replication factor C subunit 1